MFRRFQHIHFIGIGGIGMSGIAEVLANLGYDCLDLIERRGFGLIYKIRERSSQRIFAAKMLRPEFRDDPQVRTSFANEIERQQTFGALRSERRLKVAS